MTVCNYFLWVMHNHVFFFHTNNKLAKIFKLIFKAIEQVKKKKKKMFKADY